METYVITGELAREFKTYLQKFRPHLVYLATPRHLVETIDGDVPNVTPQAICRAVENRILYDRESIHSRRQQPRFVEARYIAQYLCSRLLRMPYARIAAHFQMHHTTVMYGVDLIADRIKSNEKLRRTIESLEKELTQAGQ